MKIKHTKKSHVSASGCVPYFSFISIRQLFICSDCFYFNMYLSGMFSLFILVAANIKYILDTKRQNKTHARYKTPIFNTPKFNNPILTQNRQIIPTPKYSDLR